MGSVSTDKQGNRRILFVAQPGVRKAIRLGRVPMKQANEIKLKVEALSIAKLMNLPPDMETSAWVAKIGDDLRAKVAAVGLVEGRQVARPTMLGAFVRDYIDSRTDVKPRARINLEQAQRRLDGKRPDRCGIG